MLYPVTSALSQSNIKVRIENLKVNSTDGDVVIKYDILNSKHSDSFNINLLVTRLNGNRINFSKINGDIFSGIKGGSDKSIIWEANKDGYILDEKINIELLATKNLKIPIYSHLLKSLVFPGYGDYRIRNGWHYFVYGLAAYGFIYGSYYYNNQAYNTYEKYKSENDIPARNTYYNDFKSQRIYSYIFAGAASAIWVIDITTVWNRAHRVSKNIKPELSSYYYNLSKKEIKASLSQVSINTKTTFDYAVEQGDKLFYAGKYDEALFSYNEAKKIKPESDLINQKILSTTQKIDNYKFHLKKGDSLYASKDYQNAQISYQLAESIWKKDNYPSTQIEIIKKKLIDIETERQFNELSLKGEELYKIKDYTGAISYFEKANKIKPDEQTIVTRIKEINIKLDEIKKAEQLRKYQQLIAEALQAFKTKDYLTSRNLYYQSNEYTETDYPNTQIEKIDRILKEMDKIVIPLLRQNNSLVIEDVKINGVELNYRFILDSGADNVLVSPEVFLAYYRGGVIKKRDIKDYTSYEIADGSSVVGIKFNIREITFGSITLYDVPASVLTEGGQTSMLMGGSALKQLGKVTIDYDNNLLIIDKQ